MHPSNNPSQKASALHPAIQQAALVPKNDGNLNGRQVKPHSAATASAITLALLFAGIACFPSAIIIGGAALPALAFSGVLFSASSGLYAITYGRDMLERISQPYEQEKKDDKADKQGLEAKNLP